MKLLPLLLFLSFAGWVILDANTGNYNVIVDFIREVPNADKVGHFFLFGVFTFLLNMTLRLHSIRLGKAELLTGSLIVLVIAMIEEFSQIAIISRTFNWLDIMSNVLGIATFSFLIIALHRRNWRLAL